MELINKNKINLIKRKLFYYAVYSSVLALLWIILSSELTIYNYLFGFILSYLILIYVGELSFPIKKEERKSSLIIVFFKVILTIIRRIWKSFVLIVYFLYELIKANIIVTIEILTPNFYMQPAVIAYPLELKTDFQISILTNFLTLTPGSLTLDVSSDKKTLFIHSMYVKNADEFINAVKNKIEKKILDIFI